MDLLGAKSPVSAPLKDKHVVNAHHLVRKSQNATCTQNEYPHVVHFKLGYHVIGLKQTRELI